MERIIEQGILYDFYGPLLTKHQQEIYEAVVYENLSLGEIAAEKGISRQGVHDLIKRCDKTLADYEEKLHLIERFGDNKKKLARLKELTGELTKNSIRLEQLDNTVEKERAGKRQEGCRKEILGIIDELLDELD